MKKWILFLLFTTPFYLFSQQTRVRTLPKYQVPVPGKKNHTILLKPVNGEMNFKLQHGNSVYRLRHSNMPCIVPDMKVWNQMPNMAIINDSIMKEWKKKPHIPNIDH